MASPAVPIVDYRHLPGQEHNPLMESSLHSRWVATLLGALRHTLAAINSDSAVTGNSPFVPGEGEVHTAPDIMIVANMRGRDFGRYEVGRDGPPPLVCIEVLSPSNSRASIDRRLTRWLVCGVGEVYLLDPERQRIYRVELIDDALEYTNALGRRSAVMNATFALVDGRLVVCCPAGRPVGVDDDSYAWLEGERRRADEFSLRADQQSRRADQETRRADQESLRASEIAARLAAAERELAALKAQLAEGE